MIKSSRLQFLVIIVLILSLAVTTVTVFARPAALGTSPILGPLADYSVLGGAAVTNTGATTTTGIVGVSPGSSIGGFPPGLADGDNTVNLHIPPTADAAQADALSIYDALDQNCDTDWTGEGVVDLTLKSPLVPGVYCATAFTLTGVLNLSGGAAGVYIFKSASTLITSPGSSIVGGDPCNVWWRVESSTTLDTTTSFIGTVISEEGVNAMNTGATLNGRFVGLSAASVDLNGNTISGPVCLIAPLPTATTAEEEEEVTPVISGLPDSGGAPIRNEFLPWGLVIFGGLSVIALVLGVQVYLRKSRSS